MAFFFGGGGGNFFFFFKENKPLSKKASLGNGETKTTERKRPKKDPATLREWNALVSVSDRWQLNFCACVAYKTKQKNGWGNKKTAHVPLKLQPKPKMI